MPPATTALGGRLRKLRVAAGMTQTELAGNRFSKEYVSQIERGKSRPTRETTEWLAARLGVDPAFLDTGGIDPRVAAIAAQVTSGATTGFDRAVALTRWPGWAMAQFPAMVPPCRK